MSPLYQTPVDVSAHTHKHTHGDDRITSSISALVIRVDAGQPIERYTGRLSVTVYCLPDDQSTTHEARFVRFGTVNGLEEPRYEIDFNERSKIKVTRLKSV